MLGLFVKAYVTYHHMCHVGNLHQRRENHCGIIRRHHVYSYIGNGPVEMSWIYRFRLPSGYVKIAMEKSPFIVSFPIKNGDFP